MSVLLHLKQKLSSDSNLSELLKGSSVAFLLRILGIALGYLFVLIVAHYYGAEAMGLFTLSFTVLQIASIISILGMDTLILRFTGEYVGKGEIGSISVIYKNVMLLTVPVAVLLSIALYFSATFIANYVFNNASLISFFKLSAVCVLPITLLYIHREALRGLKKIMLFTVFSGISISLLASIALLVLSNYSNEVIMPYYAQVIAVFLSAILSILAWQHYLKLKQANDSFEMTGSKSVGLDKKSMLMISMPMMLSSSLFLIMNWTDVIVLGMYRDATEVGIYSVALKVALVTSIVLTAVNSISAPKFAEMWGSDNRQGLEKVVKQSTKLIFWLSLPILMFIWLFPNEILNIFGSEFSSGVTVLLILTIGQLFNAISGSVGTLLSMTGHQVIVQNVLIFSIIINVLLNLLLVSGYGMLGIAVATMTSTVIWNGLMMYYVWKKLGFMTLNIGIRV